MEEGKASGSHGSGLPARSNPPFSSLLPFPSPWTCTSYGTDTGQRRLNHNDIAKAQNILTSPVLPPEGFKDPVKVQMPPGAF